MAVKSARLRRRRYSREELPNFRGQGPRLGGATPRLRPGAAAGRSYPHPEARGGGREEQSHVQEAVAARAQEGQEELLHDQGQEGRHEKIALVQGKEQP